MLSLVLEASISVSCSIPHSCLVKFYELFYRVKKSFTKMNFFCSLEGFLQNGPQGVQKGHVKETNRLKQYKTVLKFVGMAFLHSARKLY